MTRLCLSVIAGVTVIFCLLSNSPASGWYKQVPNPHYYSVGRASGLLQGVRRSEYVQRGGIGERTARNLAELSDSAESSLPPATREWDTAMVLCVKEVTPLWSSCAAIAEDPSIYICKANVRLTFAAKTCEPAEH